MRSIRSGTTSTSCRSRSIRERQKWLSAYDLQKYTAGFSKCEGVKVGSATVQLVCEEYATRRRQFKKARLNWRVSNPKSPKRSLGWIPFKKGGAAYRNGQVKFCGLRLGLWDSYGLSKYELRAGSISQDARGRWYLNVAVEVEAQPQRGNGQRRYRPGTENRGGLLQWEIAGVAHLPPSTSLRWR